MKLIATKSLRYNGARLEPGDEFEVRTAGDGRLLKAIGKASDAPVEQPPVDEDDSGDEANQPKPRRGRYARKDVRAAD